MPCGRVVWARRDYLAIGFDGVVPQQTLGKNTGAHFGIFCASQLSTHVGTFRISNDKNFCRLGWFAKQSAGRLRGPEVVSSRRKRKGVVWVFVAGPIDLGFEENVAAARVQETEGIFAYRLVRIAPLEKRSQGKRLPFVGR